MLRKLILFGLLTLATLFVVAAACVFVLLRTPPGQHFVLDLVLPRLARETGVTIEVGGVGGAWPAELWLSKVRLRDADGVWFEADRIAVAWQPELALSGRYVIDAAVIKDGHLLREPELPGPDNPRPKSSHYPSIRVGTFKAENFRVDEPVLALSLDLDGGVELRPDGGLAAPLDIHLSTAELVSAKLAAMLGPKVHLVARVTGTVGERYAFGGLNAQSADGSIKLAGSGSYEVATRVITADLAGLIAPKVAAEIDPKVSTLEPMQVSLRGEGPWKNLKLALAADIGPIVYDTKRVPASHLDANLVMAHREIEGPVRIVFNDAAAVAARSSVAGQFFWDRRTAIKLSGLTANYLGAHVTGDLAFDTGHDTLHAAIVFDIQSLAALPLPVDARGPLQGKANIDLDETTSIDVQMKSALLTVEGTTFEAFDATANGALEHGKASITARSVSREGLGRANALSIVGGFGRDKNGTQIGIDKLSLEISKIEARLATPTSLTIGTDIKLAPTDIRWGEQGRITVSGSIGRELIANLTVDGFELPDAPLIAQGRAAIDTSKSEVGSVSLKLVPAKGETINLRSDIEGRWSAGRFVVTGAIEGYGQDAAFGRIEPVRFSMPLSLDRRGGKLAFKTDGPIDGRVLYKGPIDRFLLLAPLAGQSLKGTTDLDISVSGTLEQPRFSGHATLRDGTYEDIADGISLDRLSVDGNVEHSGDLYVLSLDVAAGDGRGGSASPIKAKGTMQLGTKPRVDASLHLDHARLVHTQQLTVEASGDLKLAGTLPGLAASGAITIHNFEFQIPNALPPDIVDVKVVPVDASGHPIEAEAKPKKESPIEVTLDVAVSARQQVYIRGRGLDSEWSSNLKVSGTVADPRLDGNLDLRRGNFDFSGRRFDLDQGTIHFTPSRSSDPDLAIEARNETPSGTTAIINVSGKASRPDIKLTSDPALPQEDVMSLVLFGRPADELSALQAVQVANAVATLTGESPFSNGPGILDRARTGLGLDLLDVSLGAEGAGVTLGKYIRRGVFVSASPGIGGKAGSVSANVDVSKSISIETSVGQDAQESVGVNWKHDY